MKKKILFLTEASNKIGYGHLSRCLSLSEVLKSRYKFFFLSKYNIKEFISESFNTIKFQNCNQIKFDCLIIDLKNINKTYLNQIKKLKIKKKIIISDKIFSKLNPSLSIIPYINKIKTNKKRNIISGLDAIILNKNLINIAKYKKKKINSKNITICLGGSDPKNFTLRIIKDLIKINLNLNFTVIIGSLYKEKNEKKLRNTVRRLKSFKIIKNPKNLYNIFQKSKFAIINSGNVKYEFVALGVPFLLFANDNKSKFFCKLFKNNFKFVKYKNFDFPKKYYLHKLLSNLVNNEKTFKYYAELNKKKLKLNSIDNVVKHINNTIS